MVNICRWCLLMESWHILGLTIAKKCPKRTIISLHTENCRLSLVYLLIDDYLLHAFYMIFILLIFLNRPFFFSFHSLEILFEIICLLDPLLLLVLDDSN